MVLVQVGRSWYWAMDYNTKPASPLKWNVWFLKGKPGPKRPQKYLGQDVKCDVVYPTYMYCNHHTVCQQTWWHDHHQPTKDWWRGTRPEVDTISPCAFPKEIGLLSLSQFLTGVTGTLYLDFFLVWGLGFGWCTMVHCKEPGIFYQSGRCKKRFCFGTAVCFELRFCHCLPLYLGNMIHFDWNSPEWILSHGTCVQGPLEEEHVLLGHLEFQVSPSLWNQHRPSKMIVGRWHFLSGRPIFKDVQISFNWVETANTRRVLRVLSQRMVSDIYWSNEMTSGASWLNLW